MSVLYHASHTKIVTVQPGLCLTNKAEAAATYLKNRVGWLHVYDLLVPARRVAYSFSELDDPALRDDLRASGLRVISFWDEEYTGRPVKMLTYRVLDATAVRLAERQYIGREHWLLRSWERRYALGRAR